MDMLCLIFLFCAIYTIICVNIFIRAKSEFSDESSSPNASPAARLIMDGYSTQPTHENGTATKPKQVPILRRGLRLGPDIQNQDNTLADYVEVRVLHKLWHCIMPFHFVVIIFVAFLESA